MKIVALVGKTNVGKSTIFKRLTQSNIVIIDQAENTTRDRVSGTVKWQNKQFTLIDTSGVILEKKNQSSLNQEMLLQTTIAITLADIIAYVIDERGIDETDYIIIKKIYKAKKKMILIINKVDIKDKNDYSYYKLGINKCFRISAIHSINTGEFLNYIIAEIKDENADDKKNKNFTFSLVGQTNAGKSTTINQLLNDNRCIVSPKKNTTRDIIINDFEINKEKISLIDTPGITKSRIEKIPIIASINSKRIIKKSDLVGYIIDSKVGITRLDQKIINFCIDNDTPMFIIFNKIDLIAKKEQIKLKWQLPVSMHYQKKIFISALNEKCRGQIINAVIEIKKYLKTKVKSTQLNNILQQLQFINQPKKVNNRRLKIYYGYQINDFPFPYFQVFVNDTKIISDTYKKFLHKKIYNLINIKYVPIKINFKKSF